MPGSPNPRIYYTDHYPTPRGRRLSYVNAGLALLEAGWPRKRELLVTALAVMNAESARDPLAYLAYVDLGVDRHSELGLERRAKIDAFDRKHPGMTLTTYRYAIRALTLGKCKVVRADVGLFQIGWPTHNEKVGDLTKPAFNCRRALKVYRDNGNTFRPWAAYTTARPGYSEPPYRWYLDAAREAVALLIEYGHELEPE